MSCFWLRIRCFLFFVVVFSQPTRERGFVSNRSRKTPQKSMKIDSGLEPRVTAEEFCLSPTARVIFARQPSKHRRTVQRFLKIIGLKKVNKLWIYPAISGRNGTAVNCFTAAPLTLMLMIKHCITPKVSALDDKTSSHSQRNGS